MDNVNEYRAKLEYSDALILILIEQSAVKTLEINPLLVSGLILLAPVVEPQQENDSYGAEQFVPNRDVTNNRRRPAHGYHQHTCYNMNRYHKNLVLVHNLKNH